jgi:predicted acetyltransferase
MSDEITLRSPAADELRAFTEPLLAAFASDFVEAEFAAERSLMEPERFVNAFIGGARVGSGGAFGMRLTVPGGEVAASGITAIGVSPDHTRKGVLRRMMQWLWDDARAHREPVAILLASEAAIYQRFGFGVGSLNTRIEVERTRMEFRDALPPRDDARVRLVDVNEMFELARPIYEALRPQVPGTLDRPDARWRELVLSDAEFMRRGDGPTFRAVLEVGGEPRAYAIYRVKSDWTHRGPQGTLLVQELMAIDPDAEQRLWQWISTVDLVSTIVVWRGAAPHPLQLWLQEPRRLGATVFDGLWLRILDVAPALTGRTYTGEGSLVLDLEDALVPANAGRWVVAVDTDGSAAVSTTTDEPDLAMDISALACAYLGAYRFADLASAGRVHERRPGAVQAADVLFMPPRAPYSNTFF